MSYKNDVSLPRLKTPDLNDGLGVREKPSEGEKLKNVSPGVGEMRGREVKVVTPGVDIGKVGVVRGDARWRWFSFEESSSSSDEDECLTFKKRSKVSGPELTAINMGSVMKLFKDLELKYFSELFVYVMDKAVKAGHLIQRDYLEGLLKEGRKKGLMESASSSDDKEVDSSVRSEASKMSKEEAGIFNSMRVDELLDIYRKALKVLGLDEDEKLYQCLLKEVLSKDYLVGWNSLKKLLKQGVRERLMEEEEHLLKRLKVLGQGTEGEKERKKYLEDLHKAGTSRFNRYVIEKLVLQCEVWELMCSEFVFKGKKFKWFPIFEGIKFEDVWKLLIDGRVHDKGAYVFEKEMGYIRGMLRAFAFILRSIQEQTVMNFGWFHELRKALVAGVYYCMFRNGGGKQEVGVRGESYVCVTHFTREEIPSLVKSHERLGLKQGDSYIFKRIKGRPDLLRKVFVPYKDGELKRRIGVVFKQYYKDIESAKSKKLKERVCLDLGCRLVMHHVHSDGNMRMATLVLYRVFIENGLDLFILKKWIIENKGRVELMRVVREGKRIFQSLKGGKKLEGKVLKVGEKEKLIEEDFEEGKDFWLKCRMKMLSVLGIFSAQEKKAILQQYEKEMKSRDAVVFKGLSGGGINTSTHSYKVALARVFGREEKALLKRIRLEHLNNPKTIRLFLEREKRAKGVWLYVYDRLIEQCGVWEEMRKVKALQRIPFEAVWMLGIDGRVHQEYGPYGFEEKYGYALGMMRGLRYVLQSYNRGEKMDVDWYCGLRKAVMQGVYRDQTNHENAGEMYSLEMGGSVEDTLVKLGSKQTKEDLAYNLKYVGVVDEENRQWVDFKEEVYGWYALYRNKIGGQLQAKCIEVFNDYYNKLKTGGDSDKWCYELALRLVGYHFYEHGNVRLAIFTYMRALLDNELPLAIFNNWNDLLLKSWENIYDDGSCEPGPFQEELKLGRKRFKELPKFKMRFS